MIGSLERAIQAPRARRAEVRWSFALSVGCATCATLISLVELRATRCAQQSMSWASQPGALLRVERWDGQVERVQLDEAIDLNAWARSKSMSFEGASCDLSGRRLSSLSLRDPQGQPLLVEMTALQR